MKNNGIVKCVKCGKDINWVKISRNRMSDPFYEVTVIDDDESVVDDEGFVRCKQCDEPNKID